MYDRIIKELFKDMTFKNEVKNHLSTHVKDELENEIKNIEDVAASVAKQLDVKPLKIKVGDVVTGLADKHEMFEELVRLVKLNLPIYLWGKHGTGKSFTLEQVAEALGLEFNYYSQVNDEFELKGFMLPDGTYQGTMFYNAYKNGGLLMVDEIDASDPKTLIILNNALSSNSFTFPNGEKVTKHEDFRLVASANTYAGADMDSDYQREPLDIATLDRFVIINFKADAKLVETLIGAEYKKVLDIINAKCGGYVSMRKMIMFKKYVNSFDFNDLPQNEAISICKLGIQNILLPNDDARKTFLSSGVSSDGLLGGIINDVKKA